MNKTLMCLLNTVKCLLSSMFRFTPCDFNRNFSVNMQNMFFITPADLEFFIAKRMKQRAMHKDSEIKVDI